MEGYAKIRVVGRGAHGTVFLSERKSDGRLVIVKEIPVEGLSEAERAAALGEASLLQSLSHPHIVPSLGHFLHDNALCIVMTYAQGGTLADFLANRKGCLLEEHQVLHIFAQILLSLHYLHSKQIIHRDLKTQNVLLKDHESLICLLSDFGISKTGEVVSCLESLTTGESKAWTVLGTPNYMSPELCQGRAYCASSDIWSLGCILVELLTLRRAFEAPSLNAIVVRICAANPTAPAVSDHYSAPLKATLTPHPELCQGRAYCASSDIWSLGCILVELLTLRRAFEAPSLNAIVVRICAANPTAPAVSDHYSAPLKATLTPHPELCQGRAYCASSDIWSLGCILVELLTLRRAFEAPSLNAIVVRICAANPTAPAVSDHYSAPLKATLTPHPEFCQGRAYCASSDIWSLGCILVELLTLRRAFEAPSLNAIVVRICAANPTAPAVSDHYSAPLKATLTPHPELCQGRAYCASSDIWSLGCILVELLTLRRAFEAPSLNAIVVRICAANPTAPAVSDHYSAPLKATLTPHPELCQGRAYCASSDIWSLGCILVELLTLRRAFEAPSLNAIVVRICAANPTAPAVSDHYSAPLKATLTPHPELCQGRAYCASSDIWSLGCILVELLTLRRAFEAPSLNAIVVRICAANPTAPAVSDHYSAPLKATLTPHPELCQGRAYCASSDIWSLGCILVELLTLRRAFEAPSLNAIVVRICAANPTAPAVSDHYSAPLKATLTPHPELCQGRAYCASSDIWSLGCILVELLTLRRAFEAPSLNAIVVRICAANPTAPAVSDHYSAPLKATLTPHPELCQGRAYCASSDIWSLGCILVELLTLRRAFEAPSLNAIVVRICAANPTAPAVSDHYSAPLKATLTPHPELCQGRAYCASSDIWSLGCILVELLTLRRAFEAPSLNAIVVRICAANPTAPAVSDHYSAPLKATLTPHPELCQGRAYCASSDIWSLGCILVELLTLRRAFEAPSLNAIVVRICAANPTAPAVSDHYSAPLKATLTPHPELCQGRAYCASSDIWSLGCILVELLTLRRAFEAPSLNAIVVRICAANPTAPAVSDHYSAPLKKLVKNLLEMEPERRPTTQILLSHPVLIAPVLRLVHSLGALPQPSSSPTTTPPIATSSHCSPSSSHAF